MSITEKNGLKISTGLFNFINNEVIPGTNINPDKFWSNFDNFETAPLPKDKDEYLSFVHTYLLV